MIWRPTVPNLIDLIDNESIYTTDLKQDLSSLHQMLNNINIVNGQKIEELNLKNQQLEQELLKFKTEKDEMDKFVDKHYDELEEIRMRNRMLEQDLKFKETGLLSVQSVVKQLESKNIALEREISNIKHQTQNLQQLDDLEYSQRKIELDTLQSTLNVQNIDGGVQETILVNQDLQQQNNDLQERVRELEMVVERLEIDLEEKIHYESNFDGQLSQLQGIIAQNELTIAEYLNQINQLQSGNTDSNVGYWEQENQRLLSESELLKKEKSSILKPKCSAVSKLIRTAK